MKRIGQVNECNRDFSPTDLGDYTADESSNGCWRRNVALWEAHETAEGGKSGVGEINRQTCSSASLFVSVQSNVMAYKFYCLNRRKRPFIQAARHHPWSIIGVRWRVPLGRNTRHCRCNLYTSSISAMGNFKIGCVKDILPSGDNAH